MSIPNYMLSKNFNYFFKSINPSPTFVQQASSQYTTIKYLIEKSPLTKQLKPKCFLQGSYDRQTSIYTINDLDIVVLCRNLYGESKKNIYFLSDCSWTRDKIFNTIAAPLLNDGRYQKKVYFHKNSMCIKLDLGIKVEILPVIRKYEYDSDDKEPFYLYRPENKKWEDGYARYHQEHLTNKNRETNNFIPAIKIFKHIRHHHKIKSVSFHIECLLFSLPNNLFQGNYVTYITKLLDYIATKHSAERWYEQKIKTPCGERYLFTDSEWDIESWKNFYHFVKSWSHLAKGATEANSEKDAILYWQKLLGQNYFPKEVS